MMTPRLSMPLSSLLLAVVLSATAPVIAVAQTRQLSDDQIRTIEYHFKLDQYMVSGCLLGGAFGAVTGLMTLSGVSVVAAVPYISTGCSLGFLIGAATMVVQDYLSPTPGGYRHPAILSGPAVRR